MEFNISKKTDPETKSFKVVIEGDKEFNDALDKSAIFLNDIMEKFLSQMVKIYNTKKQKPYTPTEFTKVDDLSVDRPHIIAVNDYMANLIFGANPKLIDKIILIKDSNGKTIGLRID